MNTFSDFPDLEPVSDAAGVASDVRHSVPVDLNLSKPERAAIILGVLGTEAATPILEQLDETCHRSFANAMARLERIEPETVEAVIRDFVSSLEASDMTVSGGLERAREMLQQITDASVLADILDEAEQPSARNVWEKLGKIDDGLLTDMLEREHPQTAAVILDRLPAGKSASILGRLPVDAACRAVLGMNRAGTLSPKVVDAIGQSVSQDFLSRHRGGKKIVTPADKIGAIMNYAPGEMRNNVLGFLGRAEPDLLAQVRRKMFTFEDIPSRVETRDATAIVRAAPNEVLLPALVGAAENAPAAREFFLSNISSRVADQLREELEELGRVKTRDAEEAQTKIIDIIRQLEGEGALKLIELDD